MGHWTGVSRRLWQAAALIAIAVFFGCSSSLFTGDTGSDQEIGDGGFDRNCLGIDLSRQTLSVASTRALVRCLNSNGSIQAYAKLLNALSDEEVESLLAVVNPELLADADRLKEVTVSLDQWDALGIFDRTLRAAGRILENGDLISSALTMVQKGGQDPDVPATERFAVDPQILKTISIAAEELDSGGGAAVNLARGLEMGVGAVSLPSYKALVSGLKPGLEEGHSLEPLVNQVHAYVLAKIAEPDRKLLRAILEGVADQSIFIGLDHFHHEECEGAKPGQCGGLPRLTVDQQVLSMDALLRYLTRERPATLARAAKLFASMDRPILCMERTKGIANADLYMMDQLVDRDPLSVPEWAVRENMLKLKFAAGMCEYPKEMNESLDALREMADPGMAGRARGGASHEESMLVTVAHLVQGLKMGDDGAAATALAAGEAEPARDRYRRFLIDWVGDPSAISLPANLTEALAELARADRGFFANLLYFVNALDGADRATLARVVSALLRQHAQLGGAKNAAKAPGPDRSLYGAWISLIGRVDARTLFLIVKNSGPFIQASEEILAPFLQSSRDALLMNDAHPFVRIGLSVAKQASGKHRAFFSTVFGVAARAQPELKNAFALTAKMARNGSLKELLKGLLLPFRMTAKNSGANPVIQAVPPVRQSQSPDRGRSASDGKEWSPAAPHWPWAEDQIMACHALDVGRSIVPSSKTGEDPDWLREMQGLGACVDAGPMEAFAKYALEKKIGEQSLLAFLVNLGADFVRTDVGLKGMYRELGDLLTRNDTFSDLSSFQQMMRFLFNGHYGAQGLSVAQAFLRLLPLADQPGAGGAERVQPLLNVAAKAVESASLPGAAVLAYDALDAAGKMPAPTLSPKAHPSSYPVQLDNALVLENLRGLLDQVEKPLTAQLREARIQEIFSDYLSNVQTWRKKRGFSSAAEFKEALKPLLDELAKGSRLDWLLAFMHYFEGDPYDPAWWEGWFQRLSSHVFAISYIFPGKKTPEVRLVNYLDLLELIVNDSNFTLKEAGQARVPWLDGFFLRENDVNAIRHLSKLGRLAPDGDMGRWADELEQELRTFDSIPSIGGFDVIAPEVRRHLFNLKQVYFVVRHLGQREDTVVVNGQRLARNDLGVLRDLFKMLNSAMPAAERMDYGRGHALSVVTELTKFGLLRMIGKNMWIAGAQGRKAPIGIEPILRMLRDAAVSRTNEVRDANKDALALLGFLLHKNMKAGADPKTAPFDDRYVFIGKFIDQYFQWAGKPGAEASLKRAAYHLAGIASDAGVAQDLMKTLRAALSPKHADFLGAHLDALEDWIATPKAANFLGNVAAARATPAYGDFLELFRAIAADLGSSGARAVDSAVSLLEDLKEDPRKRWDAAAASLDAMKGDGAYARYKESVLEPIVGSLVHWLPKKTALRPRLQAYLAAHLRDGKARDLLRFGAQECVDDRLYEKLKFIGEPEYVRGYQDFLEDLRSGLQDM